TLAMVLPAALGGDDRSTHEVATVAGDSSWGDTGDAVEFLIARAVDVIYADVAISALSDPEDARRRVLDDVADVAVVLTDPPQILIRAGSHERLVGALREALATQALVDGLVDARLESEDVEALLTAPPAEV